MLAICDVNEYRKAVKEFHMPLVTQLFDTLHSLCNLLVVVPDNLKQVCSGEQLVSSSSACNLMHSRASHYAIQATRIICLADQIILLVTLKFISLNLY
jgi:hypothetical protein